MVAALKVKLKKLSKPANKPRKDWAKLIKGEAIRNVYQLEVQNKYGILDEENIDIDNEVDANWLTLKKA